MGSDLAMKGKYRLRQTLSETREPHVHHICVRCPSCEILEKAKIIYSGRNQITSDLGLGVSGTKYRKAQGIFMGHVNVLYLDCGDYHISVYTFVRLIKFYT